MTREEKSKFEFEEKKFSLLLKVASQATNAHKPRFSVINWTFLPRIQISIFLCETTQNDHNRLLYRFENDQKKLVVLGVVDIRQLLLSVKTIYKEFYNHTYFFLAGWTSAQHFGENHGQMQSVEGETYILLRMRANSTSYDRLHKRVLEVWKSYLLLFFP